MMIDAKVANENNERRQEMKQLLSQIAELEKDKKTLREMKDAIIHSLSSPIESIADFSSELKSRLENGEECDIGYYVNHINKVATRSRGLVKELIGLVRATSNDLRLQAMDLTATVNSIVAGYRDLESNRSIELEVQPGMEVYGDSALIRVLMMELIGNAWKYTAGQSPAKIEIGCQDADTETIYYVRDNGIGFEPVWAGMLFKPFKRYCDDPAYEGTGIGLATVAQIVERHRGRVWAVGYPNQGATIYVALPSRKVYS